MSDLISRQAAIETISRMMPKSYTLDGSHPADEEIFMAQEIYRRCERYKQVSVGINFTE